MTKYPPPVLQPLFETESPGNARPLTEARAKSLLSQGRTLYQYPGGEYKTEITQTLEGLYRLETRIKDGRTLSIEGANLVALTEDMEIYLYSRFQSPEELLDEVEAWANEPDDEDLGPA